MIDDWMAGTEWTVLTLIFAVGMLAFLESLVLVGVGIPGVARR